MLPVAEMRVEIKSADALLTKQSSLITPPSAISVPLEMRYLFHCLSHPSACYCPIKSMGQQPAHLIFLLLFWALLFLPGEMEGEQQRTLSSTDVGVWGPLRPLGLHCFPQLQLPINPRGQRAELARGPFLLGGGSEDADLQATWLLIVND